MKKVTIAAAALAVSIISVGVLAAFAMSARPVRRTVGISAVSASLWNKKKELPTEAERDIPKGNKTEPANRAYFEDGEAKRDTIVGSEEEGFRYVGDNGVTDNGFCGCVEVNGESWNVINGKATKVVTDSDKTLSVALKALEKCTNSGMSKEEKLRAAFDYLQNNYLEGVVRDDYRGMDWPTVYANDILVGGKGDCFSYGAAFAYMAKGIGYTEAYACNSGGHGWAEVDGKVYDPEWGKHSTKYSYFGMSYDADCDVPYKTALGTADWMHVKV